MTTDTTNHHPDPAIHDDDRDDPRPALFVPELEVRPWTDYPPCQRCGDYHQSTPDRCVGAVALADEAETVTRPDVVVTPGSGTAVLSGDRALDLIDVVGYIRDASYAGWLVPVTDLPRLRTAAHTRGWTYLVVDTGPWIFGRKVLLPAGVVERVDTVEHKVYVDRTKDQIKAAPECDQTVDDAQYRERLGGYYAETYNGPDTRM
ncbi:MAG TPA: PRC-barrel domain-containing protein [Jiangellaceae bacterium]|nr:PRC-barrel domain-containing protein [Jiangellaceae bacterium]